MIDDAELSRLQRAYQTAVDAWVMAIRAEEKLASVPHSVAGMEAWDAAHVAAEDARRTTERAKDAYEAGLRARFFGID